jgi:hypothetical protein
MITLTLIANDVVLQIKVWKKLVHAHSQCLHLKDEGIDNCLIF